MNTPIAIAISDVIITINISFPSRSNSPIDKIKIAIECLDQMLFWNDVDLQKKLDDFTDYYNNHRVHSSLNGVVPTEFGKKRTSPLAALSNYDWHSFCRGLYQLPIPT